MIISTFTKLKLFSFLSGGHQADESAAATQERTDHKWDLGDEGKQKLQHRQLPGQVGLNSLI